MLKNVYVVSIKDLMSTDEKTSQESRIDAFIGIAFGENHKGKSTMVISEYLEPYAEIRNQLATQLNATRLFVGYILRDNKDLEQIATLVRKFANEYETMIFLADEYITRHAPEYLVEVEMGLDDVSKLKVVTENDSQFEFTHVIFQELSEENFKGKIYEFKKTP